MRKKLLVPMVGLLLLSHDTLSASTDCTFTAQISTAIVPPLVFVEHGKVSGAATKTVLTYLHEKAIKHNITQANWARTLHSAKAGKVDAIYPAMYSEERSQFLDFSTLKLGDVSTSLYASNVEIEISNHHVIAVPRDLHYDKSQLNGAETFEVVRFEQALRMLELGRVDYVVGVTEIVDHLIENKQIANIQKVKSFGTTPIYLALAKNAEHYQQLKYCLNRQLP